MNLPELGLQFVYSRFAWSVVATAFAVAIASRWWTPSRGAIGAIAIVVTTLQLLPGELSAAYWLGLAFQSPSALLVALCAVALHRRWTRKQPGRLLPGRWAAVLAVAGAFLYVDAIGWTAHELYFLGFGPMVAPAAAIALACGCVLAIAGRRATPHAVALLAAVSAFMLLRLPTGNLWDALLDPFLWGWSVAALVGAGRRRWKKRRDGAPGAAAAMPGQGLPETTMNMQARGAE